MTPHPGKSGAAPALCVPARARGVRTFTMPISRPRRPWRTDVLTAYGADGEVAVPLLPKRALTLAQELLTRGVQAIKADSWDGMYEQGAPQRAPDLGAAAK